VCNFVQFCAILQRDRVEKVINYDPPRGTVLSTGLVCRQRNGVNKIKRFNSAIDD
jgi:hypothetical protein